MITALTPCTADEAWAAAAEMGKLDATDEGAETGAGAETTGACNELLPGVEGGAAGRVSLTGADTDELLGKDTPLTDCN